eukprot:TRINITY_DN46070_c0_g1_i1.p1 TRINITY_DN46070_c0_g1~~TRINITY_DN46070_c0_g1_i1.p1  ORF type:complete len:160 (-),score=22.47 TRINITY_DN46070_c0_g1_i1:65-544(-)
MCERLACLASAVRSRSPSSTTTGGDEECVQLPGVLGSDEDDDGTPKELTRINALSILPCINSIVEDCSAEELQDMFPNHSVEWCRMTSKGSTHTTQSDVTHERRRSSSGGKLGGKLLSQLSSLSPSRLRRVMHYMRPSRAASQPRPQRAPCGSYFVDFD